MDDRTDRAQVMHLLQVYRCLPTARRNRIYLIEQRLGGRVDGHVSLFQGWLDEAFADVDNPYFDYEFHGKDHP